MKVYASSLVIYKSQLLLAYHSKLRAWVQPGGKVEDNESILAGVRRELDEETGLSGFKIVPPPQNMVTVSEDYGLTRTQMLAWPDFQKHIFVDNNLRLGLCPSPLAIVANRSLVDLFFVVSATNPRIRLNKREHREIRWLKITELQHFGVSDKLLLDMGSEAMRLVSPEESCENRRVCRAVGNPIHCLCILRRPAISIPFAG